MEGKRIHDRSFDWIGKPDFQVAAVDGRHAAHSAGDAFSNLAILGTAALAAVEYRKNLACHAGVAMPRDTCGMVAIEVETAPGMPPHRRA